MKNKEREMTVFEKVLFNVKRGKVARIDGTRQELRDAEKAIRELDRLDRGGQLLTLVKKGGSLYVARR
jgi:hypothetical protein